MPYTKVGLDAIHHGKRLFDLLCNLKNFGRERIIYSTLEQKYKEPSFYRILLAQLEMDLDKPETFGKESENPWTMRGTCSRVVTERVYRGMRYTEPFNITAELNKQMQFADYRLVPKGMKIKLTNSILLTSGVIRAKPCIYCFKNEQLLFTIHQTL